MIPNKGNTFNSAAASYDKDFTYSDIGKRQRARVFHWLKKSGVIDASSNVFEINCGTGYDAEYFYKKGYKVVATDASSEMVKFSKENRSREITFYQLRFQDISRDQKVEESDFVFSNFGGLNCLSEKELTVFLNELAEKQKSGATLAVVIMPKHCPSEDLYLLLKGKAQEMGRRYRKEYLEVDVNGEKVKTYYHSPDTVKNVLHHNYSIKQIKPVATFLPPSYLEPFFKKRVWLLNILNLLERTFGRFNFLAAKADHYIIIAKRK